MLCLTFSLYFVDKALLRRYITFSGWRRRWHPHSNTAQMSYRNPLHTISVPSTSYTSLGAPSAPKQSSHSHPRRVKLPLEVNSPSSKWRNHVGRTSGVKPITFDWRGRQPGEGVKMVELAMRGYEQLANELIGGHDLVFKTGLTKITFHIMVRDYRCLLSCTILNLRQWPGYSHVDWCRSVEINTRFGPMTRAQLGTAIASMFMRWIDVSTCIPSHSTSVDLLYRRPNTSPAQHLNGALVPTASPSTTLS